MSKASKSSKKNPSGFDAMAAEMAAKREADRVAKMQAERKPQGCLGCMSIILLTFLVGIILVSYSPDPAPPKAPPAPQLAGTFDEVAYFKGEKKHRVFLYVMSPGTTEAQAYAKGKNATQTAGRATFSYFYEYGKSHPGHRVTTAKSLEAAQTILLGQLYQRGYDDWRYAHLKGIGGGEEFYDCKATPKASLCRPGNR